jgi:hypothetical protein
VGKGVRPVITELHSQGLGLSAIAREMNRRGIKTARGRQWEPATVRLYVPTESAV